MGLVKDIHYKVVDSQGVIQGYFPTEGLAHQYIQKEYPYPLNKRDPDYREQHFFNGDLMPGCMFVVRVDKSKKY